MKTKTRKDQMRKLTDVQISRVLSLEAIGLLDHARFGSDDGCHCVAGAALEIGPGTVFDDTASVRAHAISRRVSAFASPYWDIVNGREKKPYTVKGPDAVLGMLEWVGLA